MLAPFIICLPCNLIINDCDLKVNTFYEKIFKKSYPQLYSQPVDNFRLHKWPVLSFLV